MDFLLVSVGDHYRQMFPRIPDYQENDLIAIYAEFIRTIYDVTRISVRSNVLRYNTKTPVPLFSQIFKINSYSRVHRVFQLVVSEACVIHEHVGRDS